MFEWNPTGFITAGSSYAQQDALPSGFAVIAHSSGYDGQFYYSLARNPFPTAGASYGIRLDNPAYRQQRIVYPALAWLLSGGGGQTLPWVLIALNGAGLCLLAWLAGYYCRCHGRPAIAGALVALYPGLQLSLARDLTEITACLLTMCVVVLLDRKRPRLATVCMVLAMLTRETTLLLSCGAGLALVCCPIKAGRWRIRNGWHVAAVPLLAFVGWQGFLAWQWGVVPVLHGTGNLGLPLVWPVRQLPVLCTTFRFALLNLTGIAFLALLIALCLATFPKAVRHMATENDEQALFADRVLVFSSVVSLVLLLCLGKPFWVDIYGFMRGAGEFAFLAILLTLRFGSRPQILTLAGATLAAQALFAARNLVAP